MGIKAQIIPFEFIVGTDGKALDGGKIYIGQPGQDPRQYPATVYWDSAMTFPAAQPVRTQNGFIVNNNAPSSIYLAGSYSLLVTDAFDVQQYYVADFYMLGSDTPVGHLELAAATGANLVGWKNKGTGAVLRTVGSKLQDTVNVKDYGAVCDGVTNDATALLNANAAALATNAQLQIPAAMKIGAPVTITAPIQDTLNWLFTMDSQITFANRQPVRPEWFGNVESALDKAITTQPNGGVVQLEIARYKTSRYQVGFSGVGSGKYIGIDNISIIGRKMPTLSNDCKSLGGGSVIEGMLLVYANNFAIKDVGIDCGLTVLTASYGGVEAAGITEAYNFTYPDTTTAALPSGPLKFTSYMENVIGLCSSPTAPVHAMLLGEGLSGLVGRGALIGCFGTHGAVVKCKEVDIESIASYCNSTDGLIIKSDANSTARAIGVKIGRFRFNALGPLGWSPYTTVTANSGIIINPSASSVDGVSIDDVTIEGAATSVNFVWGGAFEASSVSIRKIYSDQYGVTGNPIAVAMNGTTGQLLARINIGQVDARNCKYVASINYENGTNRTVKFGTLEGTNVANVLNIGYGSNVIVDKVIGNSVTDATYLISGTPQLTVGTYEAGPGTATYSSQNGGYVPTLQNSWAQFAGNDPFSVDFLGGKVHLRGLIRNGTSNNIFTLPAPFCPKSTKRMNAMGNGGSGQVAVPITIGSSGLVTINEVAGGIANVSGYLSLSGVSFDQIS